MTRRVVRGFWGPREESVEAVAGRWRRTLERLAELLPQAGAGTTEPRADEAVLVAELRAKGEGDRAVGTPYELSLTTEGEPGWGVDVSGRAGGLSEDLLQAIVIAVESPDDAEVPEARLLAAVAAVWAPDFGDVLDADVSDALDEAGFEAGEPFLGRIGYLSPGRAALLPADLEAGGLLMRDGGQVLTLAPRGDTGTVVRANVALREAGVLESLPRPMERARLDAFPADTVRAVAEVDALLAGPVPEAEAGATAVLWEGPWLQGVYEQEWTAASTTAQAHLAAVEDGLDARWGPHRSVGMRVPMARKIDGTPMPPLFRTLVDHDYLGDLSVWGPVGDDGRYVGVSLNQTDGDAPMIVAAVVSSEPIVELDD
ncbi:hypothetical protein ABZO31_19115 [Streptomyces sp. HUAS MG47]|uniref:hypothetical protein n=1 Tax=Streptomyces solicamelliae TaxID=3231716 RepID=UPI003877D73C